MELVSIIQKALHRNNQSITPSAAAEDTIKADDKLLVEQGFMEREIVNGKE